MITLAELQKLTGDWIKAGLLMRETVDEDVMDTLGVVPMRLNQPELQFDMAMARGWKLDMLNQCYRKP